MNNDYTTVKKLYYGTDLVNIAVGGAEAQVPSALTTWSVNEWGKPTSIVVKEGQTTIPYSWQRNNDVLSSCILPNSITTIAEYAFNYASTSTNGLVITLPSSLTVIGDDSFSYTKIGCDLTIPSGATANGTSATTTPTCSDAFYYTEFANHTVTLEEGTTIIPYRMFGCAKDVTIIVPSTVTFLSPKCFQVSYDSNITVKFLGNTPPNAGNYGTTTNSNNPFYLSSSSYLNYLTVLVPSARVSTYKNKYTSIATRIQGY